MADAWLNIDSTELDSQCCYAPSLEGALNGTDYWWAHELPGHIPHWFILDLGVSCNIKKVRGRSLESWDPIDVDIFVSDDKENWGAAVITGITTWQDCTTRDWVEIDVTDKVGRYVKVVVNAMELDSGDHYLTWGNEWEEEYITIFDVYGEAAPVIVTPVALSLTTSLVAPGIIFDYTLTPTTLILSLTVQTPTISFDYTLTPATLTLNSTVETPTINLDCVVTPTTLTLNSTVETPAIVIPCTVTPIALTLNSTVETPIVNFDYTVIPTTLILYLTVEAPVVTAGTGYTSQFIKPGPMRGILPNQSHSLARGLIGCWPMNEGTGRKANDLSRKKPITLYRDTHWAAGSKYGHGLEFDGIDDYANAIDIINFKTTFTIIGWIKFNTLTADKAFVTSKDGNVFGIWMDFAATNHFAIKIWGAPSWGIRYGNVVPETDTWYQLVMSYNGVDTSKLYVNGLQDGADLIKIMSDMGLRGINVGAGANHNTQNHDGLIDHILLYNRVLSPVEIAWLYRESLCMFEWESKLRFLIADVTVEPSALTVQTTLQSASLSIDSTPVVSALELNLSLQTPIVTTACTHSVSTLESSISLQTPTVLFPAQTILSDSISLTLVVQAPTIIFSIQVVLSSSISLISAIQTPTVLFPAQTILSDSLSILATLQSVAIPGFDEVILVSFLELIGRLKRPRYGCLFPTLSTSPKREGFTDEYSDETIKRDHYASGYPLINPQFTFDPRNLLHTLHHVSQTDKETIESFYNTNKSISIFWLNEQDNITYEVIFIGRPRSQLDGAKDEWRIDLGFRQVINV